MIQIAGYQKLTLKDDPGHLAAICFTQGCQLCCPFCHNPDLVLPTGEVDPLRMSSFIDYLQQRRYQLDSVVVSGGEPLLQPELPDYLSLVRSMGFRIKIDTNGALPDALVPLIDRHLIDFVALDF